ncbi:MAG: hypothetical protein KAS12_01250 [Candidatus Aenigmarchaeota archaeon]|nr:hypothetical protein [Candidatus Aenigmarchaeota archaeon]
MDYEEIKTYVYQNASIMEKNDRIKIFSILMCDGYNEKISESADGVRILLDNINESTIKKIYDYIQYKKNGHL